MDVLGRKHDDGRSVVHPSSIGPSEALDHRIETRHLRHEGIEVQIGSRLETLGGHTHERAALFTALIVSVGSRPRSET